MRDMTEVTRFARLLEQLGIAQPAEFADVMATWTELSVLTGAKPAEDLRAAVLDGKVTAKNVGQLVNSAALAVLARDGARSIARDLAAPMATLARRAVRDSAGQLIEAMRPPFDDAIGRLAASVDIIGEGDPKQLATISVGLAAAAEQQRAAVKKLDTVKAIRYDIGQCIGEAPTVTWWLASVTDADELDRARQCRGFAELLRAGFTLRLNLPDEAKALEAGAVLVGVKR
jgi:hypothetical protein